MTGANINASSDLPFLRRSKGTPLRSGPERFLAGLVSDPQPKGRALGTSVLEKSLTLTPGCKFLSGAGPVSRPGLAVGRGAFISEPM
jgi:hypothetical protein